jgi:MFS transporter, FSR family, fosmidomycin resistance protein
MSETVTERVEADSRDRIAARAVIASHSLQHVYGQGFYVVLPELYTALGLSPITAGAIESVRRIASGLASMVGGFLLDRFEHRRVSALFWSLAAMAVGYVLVGLSQTYGTILIAVMLAGAAGSIWHPAAIGLLSRVMPGRRGFIVTLHRASGSVGDVVGPVAVGLLLVVIGWRSILIGALPLSLLVAAGLTWTLRRSPRWSALRRVNRDVRSSGAQARAIGRLLRSRGLLLLLLVAGVSGIGQGGLMMWLGLYLRETQGMGSVGIGIHVGLLTGVGIVTGPLLGRISDSVGRKPVIVGVITTKTILAVLLALTGSGLLFSVLVALIGSVLFATNGLVQAAALDLADREGLEGSMIGLLWGSNALFVGAAPLLLGALIASLGYGILFWWVAALNFVAALISIAMPSIPRPSVTTT